MELLFQKYGGEQEEYGDLIQTCEKMKNEGYSTTALELTQSQKELHNITGKIDAYNKELQAI